MKRKSLLTILGAILLAIILIWLGGWLWLLAASNTLQNPLARWPVFPVACTTRGCITSATWLQHHQRAAAFSTASLVDIPGPTESFTTIVRHHLLTHATVQAPATLADAGRYREEVLHLNSQEQLDDIFPVSLDEYDRQVILPFLQQEGLRQLHKVETTEELYRILSQQRRVIILPFQYTWNPDQGAVIVGS